MHLVFELQVSMNAEESDKTTIKTENRNRNEENRRQIVDFIADNGISDSKSISKAISILCLHPLKQIIHNNGLLDAAAVGVVVKPVGGDEGEVNVFLVFGHLAHSRHPVA